MARRKRKNKGGGGGGGGAKTKKATPQEGDVLNASGVPSSNKRRKRPSSATTTEKEPAAVVEPTPAAENPGPRQPLSKTSRNPAFPSDGKYRTKRRCLALCSRGVTARYRHLLEDLRVLMPHHKKESKLDYDGKGTGMGGLGRAVNDVAEVRGCNAALFLECRRRRDAYLWVGRTSGRGAGTVGASGLGDDDGEDGDNTNPLAGGDSVGPSVKFHLSNVHTMDELRLTGNCMKGSRPVLSFDSAFEEHDHLRVVKALFVEVFGTPRGHPKSKPFVDRVMAFYWADNKIWVRNYQILLSAPETAAEASANRRSSPGHDDPRTSSLVEVGPRFVLDPIRIFRGSFGGQTLYVNRNFVPPNEVRAAEKARQGNAFEGRVDQKRRREERKARVEEEMPEDPLADVFE